LPTSALVDDVKLWVNKFQGIRATDKKIMKGTPKELTFKMVEKTKFMTKS